MEERDENPRRTATREFVDLKLASLRSEMRLLFVLSVAGNQLLAHLAFSSAVGYVVNGAIFAAAILAKLGVFRGLL